MLGIACALTVAASLGLPGLDVGTSIQLLLVVTGFRLARLVHRCSTDTDWRIPMVLGLAGRAIPTVLLVVALVAVYRLLNGGLANDEVLGLIGAATFTADVIPFVADASFSAVEHLWAVALVAQIAVAAPWLLTAKRQRLCPRNRSLLLFGTAGLLMVVRVVAIVASNPATSAADWLTPPPPTLQGAIAVWTSLDGLLIGMAIGTLPLATLHRRPTTWLATPAAVSLAVLLLAPPVGTPVVDIGIRMALAAILGGVILSSEAISGLPGWLDAMLTNAWWHRLGSRSFAGYLWHIPFAYSLTGGDPFTWQGPFMFVLIVALTLAAATTTYRSIEIPIQVALAGLASRWYRPDAILLPSAEPQRGKWVRWDDISLDLLPIPTRRRTRRPAAGTADETNGPEPLGRRLWQLGDRQIDLRPGRRSGVASPTSAEMAEVTSKATTNGGSDADQLDQSAATG